MSFGSGRTDRLKWREPIVGPHRGPVGRAGSTSRPAAPASRTRGRAHWHINDGLDGVQPTVVRVLLVESPVVVIWAGLAAV